MKTTTKKSKFENTKNAQIIKFFTALEKDNGLEICIVDAVRGIEELESFDQLVDAIENNNGFYIEIIYYSNAIEYLRKNDPSLQESLVIASQMGMEAKNLDSEILASLLATETEKAKFYDLQDEIEAFIEELNA